MTMLHDLLLKNSWMKLLSVGLAALIWYTVFLAKSDEKLSANPMAPLGTHTFTNLPVLVVATAADVRDFAVRPTVVDVTLRGDPKEIHRLTEKDVRVEVYLADFASAVNLRKRVDVFVPPGFAVEKVSPSEVEISQPPQR